MSDASVPPGRVTLSKVTALYSTTGGLRNVAATDVVQITIMFLGTVAFTTIVIQEVGGLAAMTDRVYQQFATGGPGGIRPDEILAFTPDRGKDVTPTVLSLLGVLWLINSISDGSGYLAQRSMACRTDRDARTAAVVFTFTRVLVTSLLWVPLGIGLLVLFPPDPALSADVLQAEREATYIRGMAELLPVGVKGLMVTAMLAALASTVDTHLNWGSSYWTNDIYKRFICQSWGRQPCAVLVAIPTGLGGWADRAGPGVVSVLVSARGIIREGHSRVRAMTLARSTPKLTLSFSIGGSDSSPIEGHRIEGEL